jgi:hypothetical protein
MTRMITVADFLTQDEQERAIKLHNEASPGSFARRCADEIITPVLPRINKKLGQENDAKYLAYVVEYAIVQSSR